MSFEGSYRDDDLRIGPDAVLECKICWTPYDPAVGDETRQVLPGTPFTALPDDWGCPHCGAPKAQFMVLSDPALADDGVAAQAAALEADFGDIWATKMRGLPMCNPSLHVEALGFAARDRRRIGVLIAPWFMNLILLPEAGAELPEGAKTVEAFPSGEYEFLHNRRPSVGAYAACSLFSPMGDFASQEQAREVARAVLAALYDPAHRDETDRAADIRAAREAALAPPPEVKPSRRAFMTGGMAHD